MPSRHEQKLWRYTDLAKFLDLLQRKKAVLVRVDRFQDTSEGKYSEPTRTAIDAFEAEHKTGLNAGKWEQMRKGLYAWCWHMSDFESDAMWRLYGAGINTVALQTDCKRLVEVVGSKAFIGSVTYIDFQRDVVPWNNSFYPALFKRNHFTHERELRVVEAHFPVKDGAISWSAFDDNPPTIEFDVDLTTLVEAVYVPPGSPDFFLAVVKKCVTAAGLSAALVHRSIM